MAGEMKTSLSRAVWALIAAHLAIAVPLAYWLNIWSDEGSSLYSTEHGLGDAFWNAGAFERQAPLYFWMLALWRDLNGSIFFARIPSIAASCAAIWLFAKICARVCSPRAALAATAFFALHPILFWASAEIRVYAFVVLIATALLYFFMTGFFETDAASTARSRVSITVL